MANDWIKLHWNSSSWGYEKKQVYPFMTVVIVLELRIKETEEIQQESKKVWKLKPELN